MQKIKIKKPKSRRTWTVSPVTRVKESGKVYERKGKHPRKEGEEELLYTKYLRNEDDYKYCPRCSSELVKKTIDHNLRKVCPVCKFVLYRNPSPASGIIIEKEGEILLVRRKFNPYMGDWSLPAGFIEYGESPESCALRETKEETNLEVKLSSLFKVYSGSDDPRTRAILIVYLGKIVGGEPLPGDDASEVKFFSKENIPSNIAFQSHRQALRDYLSALKS
ncbi:MAG: NUDIX hydrolase [candidate division Zixibacteria bacterium]|nr:NUDIX hydrolase [candidate division Zixibacteria bacterium]